MREPSGPCFRIRAPDDVSTAITPVNDWVANDYLPEIALSESPVEQQAKHELDLDGSLVRIATTKEP